MTTASFGAEQRFEAHAESTLAALAALAAFVAAASHAVPGYLAASLAFYEIQLNLYRYRGALKGSI